MTIGWKSLSWSAAAVLLLLSLSTFLNVITAFLIMTPFVVLYTLHKPKIFALHVIIIGIIAYFLSGAYGPIVITLAFFFLIPSVVMGHLYKKGKPARTVIVAGGIVILVQLLLELVLFSVQFDIDLSAELSSLFTERLSQLNTEGLFPAGWAAETGNAFGDAIMNALPMLLLLTAFLFTIVTHGLSRRALRTVDIQVPALPQAKTWRVPRSFVFYYLIAMVASLLISEESGGYWTVAITNLVPILQYAFIIQAIGFFFFLADAKKWSRAVPILLTIPVLLFPPFYLIGLLDAAFPLRKYFVK